MEIRRAEPGELDDVVALAGAALGWQPGDPNEALFRWKHLDNPFGASPSWVAQVDGRLAAFRTFLRWRWQTPDGRTLHAVRAVDTATHPDFQGQGLFTTLTRHGLEELRTEGVAFVFNTPNDQSRPGYLKMGWHVVGQVPVAVSLRRPSAAIRMAAARVPAGKWSLDTDAGVPAADALADTDGLAHLLDRLAPPRGLRTARDVAFLRWRYAEGPIHYRALLRGRSIADGVALFRLRRRGPAIEATLCDVLAPATDRWASTTLIGRIHREAAPDYVIRVQSDVLGPGWSVPVPGMGPTLTWRAVTETRAPSLAEWDLRLGDIELF